MPLEWSAVKKGLDPKRFTVRTAPGPDRQKQGLEGLCQGRKAAAAGAEETGVEVNLSDYFLSGVVRGASPVSSTKIASSLAGSVLLAFSLMSCDGRRDSQ